MKTGCCHDTGYGSWRCRPNCPAGRSASSGLRSRTRGFTLIEVMLAVALLSFVIAAIYASWTAILRSSKVGLDAAAEAQRTRMALRAITESLSSAQLYLANLPYYSFVADTSEDFAFLSFVGYLPASFPGSGLFHGQAVRRVTFEVETGEGGDNQLLLRQTPLLEARDAGTPPYTIVLARKVNMFALEFLDTNRFEWVSEWPYTNRLPKMVRVGIGIGAKSAGRARPEDTLIQTVLLSSSAIPREIQTPPSRLAGVPIVPPPAIPPPNNQPVPQPITPGR